MTTYELTVNRWVDGQAVVTRRTVTDPRDALIAEATAPGELVALKLTPTEGRTDGRSTERKADL